MSLPSFRALLVVAVVVFVLSSGSTSASDFQAQAQAAESIDGADVSGRKAASGPTRPGTQATEVANKHGETDTRVDTKPIRNGIRDRSDAGIDVDAAKRLRTRLDETVTSPVLQAGPTAGNDFAIARNLRQRPPRRLSRVPTRRLLVECEERYEKECFRSIVTATKEVTMVHEFKGTNVFAVEVPIDAEAALRAADRVASLAPDPERVVSELPGSVRILDRSDAEEMVPYGVDLVKARDVWRRYGSRGGGAKVCVIDTGLRADHEDLRRENLDGSNSPDVVTPWAQDGYFYGHGTHCAGTIAAQPNGVGTVGVAPDAEIFVVRIFNDNGRFFGSDIANALYECKAANVDIVSMSFGGSKASTVEIDACNDLADSGILLLAASGNHGNKSNRIDYPAGYSSVMAVGAVDRRKEWAYFSTYGDQVDIVAPGVRTMSLSSSTRQSYRESSGTSMACPHVAGIAALMKGLKPEMKGPELRDLLLSTATDLGDEGYDTYYGHGLVDAMAAARKLLGNSGEDHDDHTDDSGATPEGDGESPESAMVRVTIDIDFDYYASDTRFEVLDMDRNIVGSGDRFHDTLRNASMEFSLPSACYWFGIRDAYGDGLCCNYGSGSYKLHYENERHIFSEKFRGSEDWQYFGTCINDITAPSRCGDGILDEVEECDDGNTVSGDGCSMDCSIEPVCGDGRLDDGEECDDGNVEDGDGCSSTCRVERASDNLDCGVDREPLKLRLYTDKYSRSENHYYLSVSETNEYIWHEYLYTLEQDKMIERQVCLDLNRCYLFDFNDSYGDGLSVLLPEGEDAVALWFKGEQILGIEPKAVVNRLMTYIGNCPAGLPKSAWATTSGSSG